MFLLTNGYAAVRYEFVTKNSEIKFVLQATGHQVVGIARDWQGFFLIDNDKNLKILGGIIKIKVAGIDTDNNARDRDMAQGVLGVDDFPIIYLKPISLKHRKNNKILMATLTIRDVSQNISIPVTFKKKKKTVAIKGHFKVKWKEFGVQDPSFLFLRVSDELEIFIDVVAKK